MLKPRLVPGKVEKKEGESSGDETRSLQKRTASPAEGENSGDSQDGSRRSRRKKARVFNVHIAAFIFPGNHCLSVLN